MLVLDLLFSSNNFRTLEPDKKAWTIYLYLAQTVTSDPISISNLLSQENVNIDSSYSALHLMHDADIFRVPPPSPFFFLFVRGSFPCSSPYMKLNKQRNTNLAFPWEST